MGCREQPHGLMLGPTDGLRIVGGLYQKLLGVRYYHKRAPVAGVAVVSRRELLDPRRAA